MANLVTASGATAFVRAVLAAWLVWACPVAAGWGLSEAGAEELAPRGPLDVELFVNHASAARITPGTPFILSVGIRNRDAVRAARAGRIAEREQQGLAALVGKKSISAEEAEAVRRRRQAPAVVSPVVVSLVAGSLTFALADASRLPWTPKLLEVSSSAPQSLGENDAAAAEFVVTPEATAASAPGVYRVVVSFNHSAKAPGQWSGRLVSNPVTITVVKSTGGPGERLDTQLAKAEYGLAVRDYRAAAEAIGEILAIDPRYVQGLTLQAQVHEAQGRYEEALDSWDNAFNAHRKGLPREDPPEEIVLGIRRMWDKLGIKLPEVVK